MKPLDRAIKAYGGVQAMADALQVSPQAIYSWRNGARKLPAEKCPDIEAGTGVPCEELLPEVSWHVLRERSTPQRTTEPAAAGV